MIDGASTEKSRRLNVLKAHVKMLFSCFGSSKAQATGATTPTIGTTTTTTTTTTIRRSSKRTTRPRSRTDKAMMVAPDCGGAGGGSREKGEARGEDADRKRTGGVRVKRKVVVVGDGECGKTCLLQRFCRDTYQLHGYLPTVFDTDVVDVELEKATVELMITDTAGQEDYDRLRPYSYPDTDAVIICFAIDNPASLENVRLSWIPEVRHFCGGHVPVLLVGNKSDLRHQGEAGEEEPQQQDGNSSSSSSSTATFTMMDADFADFPECCPSAALIKQGPVKASLARQLAQEVGAVGYWETSALLDQGVREVFQAASSAALGGGGSRAPGGQGRKGRKQQRGPRGCRRRTSLLERLGMKKSRQG